MTPHQRREIAKKLREQTTPDDGLFTAALRYGLRAATSSHAAAKGLEEAAQAFWDLWRGCEDDPLPDGWYKR